MKGHAGSAVRINVRQLVEGEKDPKKEEVERIPKKGMRRRSRSRAVRVKKKAPSEEASQCLCLFKGTRQGGLGLMWKG